MGASSFPALGSCSSLGSLQTVSRPVGALQTTCLDFCCTGAPCWPGPLLLCPCPQHPPHTYLTLCLLLAIPWDLQGSNRFCAVGPSHHTPKSQGSQDRVGLLQGVVSPGWASNHPPMGHRIPVPSPPELDAASWSPSPLFRSLLNKGTRRSSTGWTAPKDRRITE